MKRFLCLLLVLFSCCSFVVGNNKYQNVHSIEKVLDNGVSVIVDERFELVCIAFRLAGAEEYLNGNSPIYLNQVDAFFSAFKEHRLISFIKNIRESYNFAYSIVAKSSLMIELRGGHVVISSEWDFNKEFSSEYESCWNESIFRQYVNLLDSFYRSSHFHSFFVSHIPFFEQTVQSCSEVPQHLDRNWFQEFYGIPLIGVNLILGLSIGPNNYSIHDVRRKKGWDGRLTIMIGTKEGVSDIPSISDENLPVIIHEICHYYSYPIVEQYYNEMENAMSIVYSRVKNKMAVIGYGNAHDVTGEWINELFTNCYLEQNASFGCMYNVARDEEIGYIWMRRALLFMHNFSRNRDIYPTINDFMPQLSAFTRELVAKWDHIQKEFDDRHPYVVDVFPAGGILQLTTKEIRVTFSSPMMTGISGVLQLKGYEPLHCAFSACRWEDDRTFVINLENVPLLGGTTYGIKLPSYAFINAQYFSLANDLDLVFYVVD